MTILLRALNKLLRQTLNDNYQELINNQTYPNVPSCYSIFSLKRCSGGIVYDIFRKADLFKVKEKILSFGVKVN